MRAPGWVFPIADDIYLSPEWGVISMEHFAQCEITFEFYDTYDDTTGIVSDPVDPTTITGFISFNGKASANSVFMPIPNGQAVDLSNPQGILFSGQVFQLQALTSGIAGCNFIQILFDRERGSA